MQISSDMMLIAAALFCLVLDGYLIFKAEYRDSLVSLAVTSLFVGVATGYNALGTLAFCVFSGLFLGTGALFAYKTLSFPEGLGWRGYLKCMWAFAQALGLFASLWWMLAILLKH